MERYVPAVQLQTDPADKHGRFNCTAYVAAMAFDAATLGGLVISGARVRAMTNEPTPDPASPGLNIPQVVSVARTLGVELTDRTGYGWWRLIDQVRQGRAAIVQVDRTAIGDHLCKAHIDVPHAVLFLAASPGGSTLVIDPLCPAAKWIGPAILRESAEAFGRQTGLQQNGIRFAETRRIPLIVR